MHVSTGISISIAGASVLTAEILDVTPPALSRESIDISHSGLVSSPGARAFTPAKLYEWGELQVTMGFDPGHTVETEFGVAGSVSIIITFADSGAAVWTFDGFVTNYEPEAPFEDKAVATLTIKVASNVGIV